MYNMKPSSNDKKVMRKQAAPKTAKAYEEQLISLAYDRARERLENGTAKSAEIVYFLQKGSPTERLKLERAQKEVELMNAKIDAIKQQARLDLVYEEAIKAMSDYRGSAFDDSEEEVDDED